VSTPEQVTIILTPEEHGLLVSVLGFAYEELEGLGDPRLGDVDKLYGKVRDRQPHRALTCGSCQRPLGPEDDYVSAIKCRTCCVNSSTTRL
jgi:hypothetical protein